MPMNNTKNKLKGFCITLAVFFMMAVLCIQASVKADIQEGSWYSLGVRLGLLALITALLAWKVRGIELNTSAQRLRAMLGVIFLVILFAPLLGQFSFLEKSVRRVSVYLAEQRERPADKLLHVLREFPGTYQQYVSQNFQLPAWYVQLNAMIKVHVFGFSPNNNITKGINGFYYEGMGSSRVEKDLVETFDNIADYMGQIPFSDVELRQWKITLEERRYWLKQRGSEYVFVLAPTKAFVYPEYLPRSIQEVRGRSRYSQLADYLQKHADINFIDLLPSLLEAKKEQPYPLLFYKTDFHWNFYGAFVGYKTIVKGMEKFFPEYRFDSPKLDDFDMIINKKWAHERFMFMLGLPLTGHRNEHHITMRPKPAGLYDQAADLPPEGIYDVYPPMRRLTAKDGATLDARLILNPAAPIPSMVLLGDSFLEKCVYFFSANAKRVLNFRTIVNFPLSVFHFEQPDIVVQEILNMFILRPPPENPESMKAGYPESKFLHSPTTLLSRQWSKVQTEAEQLAATNEGQLLLQLPPAQEGEIRTMRLQIAVPEQQDAQLRLLDADGQVHAEHILRLEVGDNVLYFTLPLSAVDRVAFAQDSYPALTPLFMQALDVRSDRR